MAQIGCITQPSLFFRMQIRPNTGPSIMFSKFFLYVLYIKNSLSQHTSTHSRLERVQLTVYPEEWATFYFSRSPFSPFSSFSR